MVDRPIGAALWAVLTGCSAAAGALTPPVAEGGGGVELTRVAPGAYAAIRTEPLSLAVNANSLFIVNQRDVVVVDAQFTREATLENLAALRRVTRLPVSVVINTHWHDDHVAGNQVYRDSFPQVRFVAHADTRADLIARGRDNRRQQLQFAPAAAARFERLLASGLGIDSTPASALERRSVESAIRIIRRYVAEDSGFRETLPDSLFSSSLTIERGERRIEIRWLGRGNTRGDAVVFLPRERVVATGDLLVHPIPFGFNSYPSEWIAVLDSVAALRPVALVPGHGPVMRDLGYLLQVRRMLAVARDRVLASAEAGDSASATLRAVRLEDLGEQVAGDEKWMRTMFGMFFRAPVVQRLLEERTTGTLP
ncbi:MAG: MBL fold metallo-hydrolase [Gemmatimonadales bacterium]